jgi:hypothetical protein
MQHVSIGLLGLDDHPHLQPRPDGKKLHPSKLIVPLTKVVYHCDLENLFHDSRGVAAKNKTIKRKAAEAAARIIKKGLQSTVSVRPRFVFGMGAPSANLSFGVGFPPASGGSGGRGFIIVGLERGLPLLEGTGVLDHGQPPVLPRMGSPRRPLEWGARSALEWWMGFPAFN